MKTRLLVLALLMFTAVAKGAEPVTVMTYNIRYDTPQDGVNQWANRRDRVAGLIAKQDPDLVGLQEVLKHQLDDLLARLPQYDAYGVGRDDGKTKGEYSAILVRRDRFKVKSDSTFWLSDTPLRPGSKGWDAALPRVVTWVRLVEKQGGDEFMLVNTHFDHRGVQAWVRSASQLRAYVATVRAAQPVPVLVSGDFNFQPGSDGYRALVRDGSLIDARPSGYTQPTALGFAVATDKAATIDHLLHTKEFRATRFEVITDNDGTHYPSDHLPVVATFVR